MSNIGNVSLSLATTLERSLDATAHNLANAGTAGYKAVRPVFEAIVPKAILGSSDRVSFVQDKGNYLDVSQGTLLPTGNPLDIAVSGNGWLGFEAEGGQTAYGRHGQLIVDVEGRLQTSSGRAVLDAGGAAVILPADVGSDIAIAGDGTITDSQGNQIGQIGMFDVSSDTNMNPIGNGVYLSPLGAQAARAAENSTISQGFIESSNVQSVVEMTRMIDIQRAYEGAVRLMEEDDQLTRQVIQRLGRSS